MRVASRRWHDLGVYHTSALVGAVNNLAQVGGIGVAIATLRKRVDHGTEVVYHHPLASPEGCAIRAYENSISKQI